MCRLDKAYHAQVQKELDTFVKEEKPFTGYEVYLACQLTITETRVVDVSSYIRELYNKGYFGPWWASTSITQGPLLYFKIQPVTCVQVGKTGRGMRSKIEGKEPAVDYQIQLTEKILQIQSALSKKV